MLAHCFACEERALFAGQDRGEALEREVSRSLSPAIISASVRSLGSSYESRGIVSSNLLMFLMASESTMTLLRLLKRIHADDRRLAPEHSLAS